AAADPPRRSHRAAPGGPDPDDPDDPDGGDPDDAAPARGRGHRGRGTRGRAAPRRSGGGRTRTIAVVAVVCVVVAGAGFAGRQYLFPPDHEGPGTGEVEVTVEPGASGSAVADQLVEQGVVASSGAFLDALGDHGGAVTPGTYNLRREMSGEAAVALLFDADARVGTRVTIREGLRSSEILELLSTEGGLPMDELEAAYADTDALGLPEYADGNPEGYLFPDTYTISPGDTAPDVLQRMVARYDQAAESTDLEARSGEHDLTADEVMAIAAIVQAESGSAEDMPKVSRVVYNRLDEGMELGMDSTCFYVIGEYGIALTDDQLAACKAADSDYATYGRTGLPSGPIVSPGEQAIEAALEPADGEWLYFVATDPENGVTEFADTYPEFEQLKAEFEANRGDL
uniref:endolytic transglycosylase MltG n=1 Tax=Nocardiopsis trehalosi TaxID=109329 RepID=UPI000A537140